MKKILIIYASYGSGHKSVANYIEEYFKEQNKNYEIKTIDVMEYGNFIAKTNQAMYNLNFKFQNSIPFTLTYELFDNKIASSPYKEMVKVLFKSKLKTDIIEYNPDILISTHFFGGILMGMLNKKKYTHTKIITILTDYASHAIWLKNHKNEHALIVSNEIVKNELIKYGVEKNKIYPFGIPLSSKFKNVNQNINQVKKHYNITNNKPIFLFFAGGSSGSGFAYNYFKQLLNEKLDINIIFVAGKNTKLQNKCQQLVNKKNIKNITILGFTSDVSNLLNISTCVISKPGGLSVTEALAMKKPMILIPGNGGQENHNAKFIVKSGFGIRTRNPKQFIKAIKKLVESPILIENMHDKLKKYEENKSIEKLYKLVERMIKE